MNNAGMVQVSYDRMITMNSTLGISEAIIHKTFISATLWVSFARLFQYSLLS